MSGTEQLTKVFLDVESTGLDPRRHKLWEIGMIVQEPDGSEQEHEFMWWPDMSTADPMALTINRFYDRAGDAVPAPWSDLASEPMAAYRGDNHDPEHWNLDPLAQAAHNVAHTLDRAVIIGACPWFDVSFLIPWLAEHGHVFTGHYHFIDIEALAVGFLRARWKGYEDSPNPEASEPARMVAAPPWKHTDLVRALGIDPDSFDRHTALGDARMARAVYLAVMGDA